MCDLAMALGLAAGATQAAGQASAAAKNIAGYKQRTQLEYAANEREHVVKATAANKEAYQASLEADRVAGSVTAQGAGLRGSTAGLRVAEQARQGALSIANARARQNGARADYVMAGKVHEFDGKQFVAAQSPNPLAAFTNMATAGLSNYGAFKS